ncbi:lysine exporter LysO family protein [Pyrococcus sp. ST04]|uniref:lysine exporter LysO family protein n=1 Tax=Pyrococcus sp. ST04 TaxID=1183377 RepID=UPI0002605F27|nr:lysine exporter LysO family protein [Pyrococcus sp. ST04]AFK22663.1 hypothetical protein Py04_1088 [Pyrococcus sp. ST04]
MKFMIAVIIALISGYIAGKFGINAGNLYEIALYILVFIIGLDIGMNGKLKELQKNLSWRGLLLPIATLIGSIFGGVLASLILNLDIKWVIVASAGVGWYSFTGPFIGQYSAFYGVVGFLSNFLREVATVVLYPTLSTKLGREVTISIGGATTMDTTLPIIVKFGGKDITMLAFIHGFILSLLVPFLVPLLATLAAGG